MDGYIYLITNTLNGKKYVGSTSRTPEDRLKEHWNSRDTHGHHHRPLCQDMSKQELHHFVIETLLEMKYFDKKELLVVEDAYIAIHDTINKGYNTRFNAFKHCNTPERQLQKYNEKRAKWREACTRYGCKRYAHLVAEETLTG
jgi:group I intron endonuclease